MDPEYKAFGIYIINISPNLLTKDLISELSKFGKISSAAIFGGQNYKYYYGCVDFAERGCAKKCMDQLMSSDEEMNFLNSGQGKAHRTFLRYKWKKNEEHPEVSSIVNRDYTPPNVQMPSMNPTSSLPSAYAYTTIDNGQNTYIRGAASMENTSTMSSLQTTKCITDFNTNSNRNSHGHGNNTLLSNLNKNGPNSILNPNTNLYTSPTGLPSSVTMGGSAMNHGNTSTMSGMGFGMGMGMGMGMTMGIGMGPGTTTTLNPKIAYNKYSNWAAANGNNSPMTTQNNSNRMSVRGGRGRGGLAHRSSNRSMQNSRGYSNTPIYTTTTTMESPITTTTTTTTTTTSTASKGMDATAKEFLPRDMKKNNNSHSTSTTSNSSNTTSTATATNNNHTTNADSSNSQCSTGDNNEDLTNANSLDNNNPSSSSSSSTTNINTTTTNSTNISNMNSNKMYHQKSMGLSESSIYSYSSMGDDNATLVGKNDTTTTSSCSNFSHDDDTKKSSDPFYDTSSTITEKINDSPGDNASLSPSSAVYDQKVERDSANKTEDNKKSMYNNKSNENKTNKNLKSKKSTNSFIDDTTLSELSGKIEWGDMKDPYDDEDDENDKEYIRKPFVRTKLNISRIPPEMTDDQLYQLFLEHGNILDMTVKPAKIGTVAFLEYSTPNEAIQAVRELDDAYAIVNQDFMQNQIPQNLESLCVDFAYSDGITRHHRQGVTPIFIKGLPISMKRGDLKIICVEFGDLAKTRLSKIETIHGIKCSATIEYVRRDSVALALKHLADLFHSCGYPTVKVEKFNTQRNSYKPHA